MIARWPAITTSTSAQRVLRDRGGLFVTLGFYAIVITVLGALWRAAAEANGGTLLGYSAAALTWYVAASEGATVPLNIRLIEEIGTDIGNGAVATEMLRPASVLGVRIAGELGRALPRLVGCMLIGTVLSLLAAGRPESLLGIAWAVPSLVLALTCNLVAQHAVAAASFWLRDARSMWFLYHKLVFILGGMLIPVQVLPQWLETTALSLPFVAMSYVPARLASGHVEPHLLLVQAGWIVALGFAAVASFNAGERRLQVVGG